MGFLENVIDRAKTDIKTIVLPESLDIRILDAVKIIVEEKIANIILIGNEDEIRKIAPFDIGLVEVINPLNYDKLDLLVDTFFEIRKNKGISKEEAKKILISDPLYFGVLLVKCGITHGMVAGAINSTADVLRPSLQILKTAKNTKLVSAFFVMDVPNCNFGENGTFIFGDCGLCQNPTSEELAEIAKSSANSFSQLVKKEPLVAMLSHSTKGSAKHNDVDKVIEALNIIKKENFEYKIDGELQLDAAIVPEVAKLKAPDSLVAGRANVLIFPDLDAGNIGYKLVERLANAKAFGPITQGISRPVNDLSRGCNAEDIVGVVAITSVQAQ